MVNRCDIWKTMYEEDYDNSLFLYHYTNVSKASKILYGKKLKFSKLHLMNDTLEAKPKIVLKEHIDSSLFNEIVEHFSYTNNNYLQLLCMSKDVDIKLSTDSERTLYSDYSGRGFALPRMWAQYADNNNGVCFVFDKSELIKLIQDNLLAGLIEHKDVRYVSNFESLDKEMESVIEYVKRFSCKTEVVKNINNVDFLKRYKNFMTYNYFSKLDDWKGENEFRFLAYGDEDYFIPDIFKAIVGIVVGESIEDTDIKIIELLNDNNCEIMKISFDYNGCTLKNVYE